LKIKLEEDGGLQTRTTFLSLHEPGNLRYIASGKDRQVSKQREGIRQQLEKIKDTKL
jgi:hypothetical protein